MYMIQSKVKVTEFESKALQIMERFDAGVDVDLFMKTVISIVGGIHHGRPVIAGVTYDLFRNSPNYIFYKDFFSYLIFKKQVSTRRVRQNQILFDERKIEMRRIICGSYTNASDPTVFQIATISKASRINNTENGDLEIQRP